MPVVGLLVIAPGPRAEPTWGDQGSSLVEFPVGKGYGQEIGA